MDEKEIAQIAAQAAAEVVEKLKATDKKDIPPEDDEEDKDKVKIVKSAEEKLLEDPKHGFKNFAHFIQDVIRAEVDEESESLKNYVGAMKKTAGYLEEGDLSQGGYIINVL